MKCLFVSHPVAPLGTGFGGGVELTLRNVVQALAMRGHQVDVIAPAGSSLGEHPVREVAGALQPSAQYQRRDDPISMPPDPVLAAMWEEARRIAGEYEVLVNVAYDWLPFYLTPFLGTPVAHLVSMSSLLDAMDMAIARIVRAHPGSVAVHTHAQARTFAVADDLVVIGNGLDLALYPFNAQPEERLCWIGRIAPEKGLEDAAAVAHATGLRLDIYGLVQDEAYWRRIQQRFAGAPLRHHGFLDTAALARAIGRSKALLMTPKWAEAFGNVVIEALACGVPVVAYRRGGPAEMIEHGRTGWLVEPDRVDGLIAAVGRLDALDRHACRTQAERDYSLEALGARWEGWLSSLAGVSPGQVPPPNPSASRPAQ